MIFDSLDEYVTSTDDWREAWDYNRYYGGFIRDEQGREWEYDGEPIDEPIPAVPA